MTNYDDFSEVLSVTDDNDNLTYELSGVANVPDFSIYKNYYKTYIITPEYQYRPDKLAYMLLGSDLLMWVLDEINFIQHDKEYKIGKEINYLDKEQLKTLGIL